MPDQNHSTDASAAPPPQGPAARLSNWWQRALGVLAPVGVVIGGKIVIDLVFHLWSVYLYRRWAQSDRGLRVGAPRAHFGLAFLAAVVEPFTFQLLRHIGAAWGWLYFLTGAHQWGKQSRGGLLPPD